MPEKIKRKHGKLMCHYEGPFLVLEKVGLSMFKIKDLRPDKGGNIQKVHGNMLKTYFERNKL